MPDKKATSQAVAGGFRRPLLAGAFAATVTAIGASPAPAMADTFLRLADIKGESTDAKHKDQIEILSFTQSWINDSGGAVGGGGGAGKVQCGAITMMKNIDKSSPLLLKGVATGQHYKDATISFVADKGGSGEYYVIDLQDILLAELTQTDNPDPNRIFEKLVLNAASFEFKYTPQSIKGSVSTPISFKWDCKANKGG